MSKLEYDLENFGRLCHLHDKVAKLEQALAEKDREYAQLKEAYDAKVAGVPLGPIIGAQTILNQQIAYNQLMEQAVYFAEIADSVCRPSGLHGAAAAARFLASPAVQQWRKEQGV